MVRSKTRKPRESRKSRKFFSEIFKSEFSILAVGQNRKPGNKKTRNNFSEISDFSKFSICHFFIFFLDIFSFLWTDLFYKCSSNTSLTKHDFLCLCFDPKYKWIHNIEYKIYLQNEKMANLWVFVDFSNKRRFEQIYKTSLQNETVR